MIQEQFLNYILQTQDSSLITLNNLTKEFFTDYTAEYDFILNHLSDYGKVPDLTTFVSEFPNFDVFQVNEPANYLVDKLYDDRNSRKLASLFNKIREEFNAGDIDSAMNTYLSSMRH